MGYFSKVLGRVFGNKRGTKPAKKLKERALRVETLEDRALLSVTPMMHAAWAGAQFAEIGFGQVDAFQRGAVVAEGASAHSKGLDICKAIVTSAGVSAVPMAARANLDTLVDTLIGGSALAGKAAGINMALSSRLPAGGAPISVSPQVSSSGGAARVGDITKAIDVLDAPFVTAHAENTNLQRRKEALLGANSVVAPVAIGVLCADAVSSSATAQDHKLPFQRLVRADQAGDLAETATVKADVDAAGELADFVPAVRKLARYSDGNTFAGLTDVNDKLVGLNSFQFFISITSEYTAGTTEYAEKAYPDDVAKVLSQSINPDEALSQNDIIFDTASWQFVELNTTASSSLDRDSYSVSERVISIGEYEALCSGGYQPVRQLLSNNEAVLGIRALQTRMSEAMATIEHGVHVVYSSRDLSPHSLAIIDNVPLVAVTAQEPFVLAKGRWTGEGTSNVIAFSVIAVGDANQENIQGIIPAIVTAFSPAGASAAMSPYYVLDGELAITGIKLPAPVAQTDLPSSFIRERVIRELSDELDMVFREGDIVAFVAQTEGMKIASAMEQFEGTATMSESYLDQIVGPVGRVKGK